MATKKKASKPRNPASTHRNEFSRTSTNQSKQTGNQRRKSMGFIESIKHDVNTVTTNVGNMFSGETTNKTQKRRKKAK